jgi:hypothetical protein
MLLNAQSGDNNSSPKCNDLSGWVLTKLIMIKTFFFHIMGRRRVTAFATVAMLVTMNGLTMASDRPLILPLDVNTALHALLDLVDKDDVHGIDNQQIESLAGFLETAKLDEDFYSANASFDAPSAFHQFVVDEGLQRIIDYTLDANIPSFFFWPTSLRTTRWIRVDGGDGQFERLRSASRELDESFLLRGAEHVTITPDQHTGAYFTYDVDKLVIISPCKQGQVMISIYKQQAPSAVGRRGWVLGEDDEWSYLYTKDKGLNVKGLGWADTYMYDSFGLTIYYQPAMETPMVIAGVFSWVNAGWAHINMVKSRHIHDGLVRVSHAFTQVMENPNLPEPAKLAATFSKSKDLPTRVLKKYAGKYLTGLKARVASSAEVWQAVAEDFDSRTLLEQMNRDELYAVLALDYLKKLLDRNPVMDSHPF